MPNTENTPENSSSEEIITIEVDADVHEYFESLVDGQKYHTAEDAMREVVEAEIRKLIAAEKTGKDTA